MDFMKAFDQTVREIKREVNLKVLKVPEIEQKVLDATDDEPWGPHGAALAEIAQATKKFTECQIVMNVLWSRLGETGKDWRYVYKALAVIEYLVSHGSERAVDDIIGHTFRISSLTSFEYVEPNGKDMGINVRKKAETIVGLLNNKEKIQESRNKAAANRDKYTGLSSSGITFKSSASSYTSGGFQGGRDKNGGLSGRRESESYRYSYKERDRYGEQKFDTDAYVKSRRGTASESQGNSSKESRRHSSNDTKNKFSSKPSDSNIYSQSTSTPSTNYDDDFDDFDPRGTSKVDLKNEAIAESSNQVDLFGKSLIDDIFDGPVSAPTEKSAMSADSAEVDLFADATFVSAPTEPSPQAQARHFQLDVQKLVDPFASHPAIAPAASPTFDLFAATDPVIQQHTTAPNSEPPNASIVDPFASIPLNNLNGSSNIFGSFTHHSDSASKESTQNQINDGKLNNMNTKPSQDSKAPPKMDIIVDPVIQPHTTAPNSEPPNASIVDPFATVPLNNLNGSYDIFGSFTHHSDSASQESTQNQINDGNLDNMNTKPSQDSKAPPKKDTFQVKSGIWADSLSRGIIDLNISAPKKVSLADVGILCGLSDVDTREKGPPTSFHMGRAMGTGSGLGKTGFTSSQGTADDDLFSSFNFKM